LRGWDGREVDAAWKAKDYLPRLVNLVANWEYNIKLMMAHVRPSVPSAPSAIMLSGNNWQLVASYDFATKKRVKALTKAL
jgi:hypothetical protein